MSPPSQLFLYNIRGKTDGSQVPSTFNSVCFSTINKEPPVPYAEAVGKEKCECVAAGTLMVGAKVKGRTID